MSNNKKIEYDKVMSFQFDDLPVRGRICQTSRSLNKIISQQIIPKQFKKSDVCDLVELLIDNKASSLSGQVLNIGGV